MPTATRPWKERLSKASRSASAPARSEPASSPRPSERPVARAERSVTATRSAQTQRTRSGPAVATRSVRLSLLERADHDQGDHQEDDQAEHDGHRAVVTARRLAL